MALAITAVRLCIPVRIISLCVWHVVGESAAFLWGTGTYAQVSGDG